MSFYYIQAIEDMYEKARTRLMMIGGDTEDLFIDIRLHQGVTLSPFLFTILMDELMKDVQDEVLLYMLFVDDIVLVDETKDGVNTKVEKWIDTLESKGLNQVGRRPSI